MNITIDNNISKIELFNVLPGRVDMSIYGVNRIYSDSNYQQLIEFGYEINIDSLLFEIRYLVKDTGLYYPKTVYLK